MGNPIVISYSRQADQAYVRRLADELRCQGFDPWWGDRIRSGDEWWPTIEGALHNRESCSMKNRRRLPGGLEGR